MPVVLDASGSAGSERAPLSFRWDLGDGTIATTARVEHVFRDPGFYRVGMTVNDGRSSALSWCDLYVVDGLDEVGTEGGAARWSGNDPRSRVSFADDSTDRVAGKESVRAVVNPYGGGRVNLVYSAPKEARLSLKDKSRLVFWIRSQNGNVTGWQGPNPVVTLRDRMARPGN